MTVEEMRCAYKEMGEQCQGAGPEMAPALVISRSVLIAAAEICARLEALQEEGERSARRYFDELERRR